MKEYKFLLKPAFFIFNLLFASWLVLKIEKIKPSDLEKANSLFNNELKKSTGIIYNKEFLKTLFHNYKAGKIDSITFDKELENFMQNMQPSLKSKH
jgi:hypothetical protein